MGTLKDENNEEFHTEELSEKLWWAVIAQVTKFLETHSVVTVDIEYGFVIDRDTDGKEQGNDRSVPLKSLDTVIKEGLSEGTIERGVSSDFVFRSQNLDLAVMLCNDNDIHFASSDKGLLKNLARDIKSEGIKLHGPSDVIN